MFPFFAHIVHLLKDRIQIRIGFKASSPGSGQKGPYPGLDPDLQSWLVVQENSSLKMVCVIWIITDDAGMQ